MAGVCLADTGKTTRIEQLSTTELPEWDAFVQRHPWGVIAHLSGWKRAVEQTFQHIRGEVVVVREGGRIVAGIPFYDVRSFLLGNRTVSVPFATLCDPLVSSPEQLETLISFLKSRSVKSC